MIAGEARATHLRIWLLLGGIGACLFVAGGVDLLLGLFPLSFGVPEWEFGAIGAFLNRFPLFGLGLTLLLASAAGRTRPGPVMLWASMLLLVSVVMFVFGLLFVTNAPLVLGAQPAGPMRGAVIKAIGKAAGQTVVYFLGFGIVSVYALRSAGRMRARG